MEKIRIELSLTVEQIRDLRNAAYALENSAYRDFIKQMNVEGPQVLYDTELMARLKEKADQAKEWGKIAKILHHYMKNYLMGNSYVTKDC